MIGSSCDQDGNYTAGRNIDLLNPKTDFVTVVDYGNGGITSQATVTVYSTCAILEIYGRDSEKVELLRKYRDTVLSQSPEGRAITRLYYAWSPILVQIMEEDNAFKEDLKSLIDTFLPLITQASIYFVLIDLRNFRSYGFVDCNITDICQARERWICPGINNILRVFFLDTQLRFQYSVLIRDQIPISCTHNRYSPVLEDLAESVFTQFELWSNPNETLRRLCTII